MSLFKTIKTKKKGKRNIVLWMRINEYIYNCIYASTQARFSFLIKFSLKFYRYERKKKLRKVNCKKLNRKTKISQNRKKKTKN